jgi:hypothetical protein
LGGSASPPEADPPNEGLGRGRRRPGSAEARAAFDRLRASIEGDPAQLVSAQRAKTRKGAKVVKAGDEPAPIATLRFIERP